MQDFNPLGGGGGGACAWKAASSEAIELPLTVVRRVLEWSMCPKSVYLNSSCLGVSSPQMFRRSVGGGVGTD